MTVGKYYILNADHHVTETGLNEWAQFFENTTARVVDKTQIGEVLVSTVFLGIDHRLGGQGPPILFETMVFGGPLDQEQQRYSSWDDAVIGHKIMVRRAQKT